MIRARENLIGARVFLVGVIIAIAVGLVIGLLPNQQINPLIFSILAILGLVAGSFVAQKDVQTFLIASVSLVIVSYMGISGQLVGAAVSGFYMGRVFSAVLQTLLALFVPATIVVAIKTVFSIAQS